MNCKWERCGNSRTVSDVICEKSPPTSCPDGDIINTTDNNQKVGIHSGHIKEGSKVPLSIFTTMCHILPQPTTEIQYNPNLSPENWINKSSSNDVIEKVALLEKQSLKEFHHYRGLFVEETLKIVLSEQLLTLYRMITSILLLLIKEKSILALLVITFMQKMLEYAHIANWMQIIMTMILILIIGLHQNIQT